MWEGKGDSGLLSGILKQWWKTEVDLVKWKQFAIVQYLVGVVCLHTSTVKDAMSRTVRGGSGRTVTGVYEHPSGSLVEGFCQGEVAQRELQCSAPRSLLLCFPVGRKAYKAVLSASICVSSANDFWTHLLVSPELDKNIKVSKISKFLQVSRGFQLVLRQRPKL